MPTVPTHPPIAPVKPRSDSIMAHLKEAIRQRRFREFLASEAHVSEGAGNTIDVIPMPCDYDVWVEYEGLKSKFLCDLRGYVRLEKLARETFPDENVKVFHILVDCISDASVQDLKRTPNGARYYNQHDSYGFFKLAIQEHVSLFPSVSLKKRMSVRSPKERHRKQYAHQ